MFLALSVKKLFQVLLASQFTVLVCPTCSPTRLFQEVKDHVKGFIITGQDKVAVGISGWELKPRFFNQDLWQM